uniref:Uncharacterized protein n=1 Tax=Thermosporothrix sp. COM3 TaxID=2490863 RepID=A0A455SFR7_9CHLR|nr:hypothetical protein KTC_20640 [Thermosporothrix sp. COM3]
MPKQVTYDEGWFRDLIADLQRASLEFRTRWPKHEILLTCHHLSELNHPLIGRRKPFVIASSLLFAIGMVVPLLWPTLPAFFIQGTLGGIAFGIYMSSVYASAQARCHTEAGGPGLDHQCVLIVESCWPASQINYTNTGQLSGLALGGVKSPEAGPVAVVQMTFGYGSIQRPTSVQAM